MNLLAFNSLRSRYAAAAAVITLAVAGSAFVAQHNVNQAHRQTSANIEIRNSLLERSRYIRDAVWRARDQLAALLMEPDHGNRRASVDSEIRQALSDTESLIHHPWIRSHGEQAKILQLHHALIALGKAAQTLIRTRTDPDRQYPALKYARGTMLPRVQDFLTMARLAMDELQNDDPYPERSRVYRDIVQIRHLGEQMIADFRMYLANRMGTFDEHALATQEDSIALQHQRLSHLLADLEQHVRNDDSGLQVDASVRAMSEDIQGWFHDFEKVKRINHSDEWRIDKVQMRDTVAPLFARIWNLLRAVNTQIKSSADSDVSALNVIALNQNRLIWILASLGLGFILAGFFALERTVLRPLATVADALLTEASDGHSVTLPRAQVRETRRLVNAFREMRRQIHQRQVALEHQALHDALTGLPNRSLLIDRMQQAIFAARRDNGELALLMMDLDRFKEINDTLGHHVGDRVLKDVAARLSQTLREMDTVARLGGDEFAILLPGTNVEQAKLAATKTLTALHKNLEIDGHRLHCSASIGIAAFPQHGSDAQTLIQRADVAMYVAKRNKSGAAVYDPREDQHSVGRLALMSDLHNALESDELLLHYQPKIIVATGSVVGVEALLRWPHPLHGWIPPDEVIPLAEQTGLIRPLTFWVLERALRQFVRWREQGHHLSVAVNLSVYSLQDSELVSAIQRLLARYRVPAEMLYLEITESGMMSDPTHAVGVLAQLDAMGVRLAVDDFGTGFSSLAYLKQLPVDELKIDKSFVMQMTRDDNDAVIVRSIIELAHNLGLHVVAEGIENAEVWDLLHILRCDQGQGYYLSVPLPAEEFTTWLVSRNKQLATG